MTENNRICQVCHQGEIMINILTSRSGIDMMKIMRRMGLLIKYQQNDSDVTPCRQTRHTAHPRRYVAILVRVVDG